MVTARHTRCLEEVIRRLRAIGFQNVRIQEMPNRDILTAQHGMKGITFGANCNEKRTPRAEVYIDFHDLEKNEKVFKWLESDKANIEKEFGCPLEWQRKPRIRRLAVWRDRRIDSDPAQDEEIIDWWVNKIVRFRDVVFRRIEHWASGLR